MKHKDLKDSNKNLTKQNSYSFLTSTNLLYRDNLPPEYSLPTLIGVPSIDLRGINTIDNEEHIPKIDFKDALTKFDILDSNDNNDDNDDNDRINNDNIFLNKIKKTYSENELCKFDDESGRRKSHCKNGLILDLEPYNISSHVTKLPLKKRVNDGIFDEYIPNFNTFNLTKFGIDENAIQDSDEESEVNELSKENKINHNHDNIINDKQKSKPIEIKRSNVKRNDQSFEVSDDSFKIAASPERDGDRKILSSIPKNFYSLSFSYRRQMLTDLLPENLKNDTDYKNHIAKIVRKNSASITSLSSDASNIFVTKIKPPNIDPDSNEMGSILLSQWRMGRVVNSGGFGIIRECFNINDIDDIRAVKVIPLRKSLKLLNKFKSEIIMWSKLKHKNIIPLYDVRVTIDDIFLFMPLCDEGSLFDRVKFWETNKIKVVERFETIILYIKQIVQALKFLHSKGIHHGDIKLENFLLDNNIPILCDFGMTGYDEEFQNNSDSSSKIIGEIKNACELLSEIESATDKSNNDILDDNKTSYNEHHINIGSLPYAAPELLQPCPALIDRQADIWAFGILIYALVLLKLPFWHIYEPRLKLSILEGNWKTDEWIFQLKQDCELNILDELLQKCLVDKEARFSINDISNVIDRY